MSAARNARRQEAAAVMAATTAPHLRLFLAIAMHTGARAGAILGLKWESVDMAGRMIDFGPPRGNKRRSIVPINDALHEALLAGLHFRSTEHVIEHGGKPVASVAHGLHLAGERAGVRITPHMIRHSVATWLVQDGVKMAEIARLLGDSEKTVEKVYGHHSPDYLRRATNALDGRNAPKSAASESAKTARKPLNNSGGRDRD